MATKRGEQYRERRKNGLCVACGKEKVSPGKVRCQAHHEKFLEWQRKHRTETKSPDRCACGSPAQDGRTTCRKCYTYHKSYLAKRHSRLLAEGRCPVCGKPPVPGRKQCAECMARNRERNRQIRDEVFAAYGGPVCRCCGETTREFLQIDHIKNDGGEHRRMGFSSVCRWLKSRGFPKGYQVLCANCNWGKRLCGKCPHRLRRDTERKKARRQPADQNCGSAAVGVD